MTNVIFIIHPNDEDVLAYFPHTSWNMEGNRMCYQHIGQHGACSPSYAEECREATPEEYADLHRELRDLVGYDDLVILNGSSYGIENMR